MTYLQDVMHSSVSVGTSSSGVSQTIYGMPWEDQSYEDTNTLLVKPELSESVNTTVNIGQKEFYKQIIQYWQRREILDRFDVLAQRKDNWDGYESKKPTQPTLDHAKNLIEELFDSIISAGHLWLTPFISSDEDGYITAEWYEKGRQLHIQIGENETEYLQVWGINIDTEMHESFLSRDNYLTLWELLLHG